jgi:hypothetical protein
LARYSAVAFSDPHNARLLWLAAGGLFFVGVVLSIGTIVWWRRAGSEHSALAKLESMRLARRPRPAVAVAAEQADADDLDDLVEHPSGPIDVGDADITSIGEHRAQVAGVIGGGEGGPAPGIDPLLRPVDAAD